MRLNIEITEDRNKIYKLASKKLGISKTEMVTKAIDKYVKEELTDRRTILEFELIRLREELKQKEALYKINCSDNLSKE